MGPKLVQDEPKLVQDEPKLVQDVPKLVQDEPKMVQVGSKMVPRASGAFCIGFYTVPEARSDQCFFSVLGEGARLYIYKE